MRNSFSVLVKVIIVLVVSLSEQKMKGTEKQKDVRRFHEIFCTKKNTEL